jgi:hypothetical protein
MWLFPWARAAHPVEATLRMLAWSDTLGATRDPTGMAEAGTAKKATRLSATAPMAVRINECFI